MIRFRRHLAVALLLPFAGCDSPTEPPPEVPLGEVLLEDNFNAEHLGTHQLNYTAFANWEVPTGSVDLVGTYPYNDFLPTTQGLYVDLDGTSLAAGVLLSRTSFDLKPGTYLLSFKMAGTPRDNQLPNTVNVTVGDAFSGSLTLPSYAPLSTYFGTFTVETRTTGRIRFEHLGGDNYGNFIDDIRFERL